MWTQLKRRVRRLLFGPSLFDLCETLDTNRATSEADQVLLGASTMFALPPPAYEGAPYSEYCRVFRRDEYGDVHASNVPARYYYEPQTWLEWTTAIDAWGNPLRFAPTHWKLLHQSGTRTAGQPTR
jgi:hypothetical protein